MHLFKKILLVTLIFGAIQQVQAGISDVFFATSQICTQLGSTIFESVKSHPYIAAAVCSTVINSVSCYLYWKYQSKKRKKLRKKREETTQRIRDEAHRFGVPFIAYLLADLNVDRIH